MISFPRIAWFRQKIKNLFHLLLPLDQITRQQKNIISL